MNIKLVSFFIVIIGGFLMTSCSDDDSEKRVEFAKIVESRTSQDLLNDLYVGSDADVEAIARIMNVTPSSIERIRKGEPIPPINLRNAYMRFLYIICRMINRSVNLNLL